MGESGMSRQVAFHLSSTLMIHLWFFYNSALTLTQTSNLHLQILPQILLAASLILWWEEFLLYRIPHSLHRAQDSQQEFEMLPHPCRYWCPLLGCRLKSSQVQENEWHLLQTVWVLSQLCCGKKGGMPSLPLFLLWLLGPQHLTGPPSY